MNFADEGFYKAENVHKNLEEALTVVGPQKLPSKTENSPVEI